MEKEKKIRYFVYGGGVIISTRDSEFVKVVLDIMIYFSLSFFLSRRRGRIVRYNYRWIVNILVR